jgi:hypothetical protein
MDGLSRSDGSEVAIALIGEDIFVRKHSLYPGGHSGRTAMSGLLHINVHVMISENSAAHRRHANRLTLDAELVYNFHQNLVDYAMTAPGTIVHSSIGEGPWLFINDVHSVG